MAYKLPVLESKHQFAAELAKIGNGVFFLAPRSKVPQSGTKGHKDAVTDPELAARMFKRSTANIGFATGNGILVVDIDGETGEDGLESVETAAGEVLPETFTVITPSGGAHLYYAYDAKTYDIRSSQDNPCPKVDIRAEGGYVVAPPSKATYTKDDHHYDAQYQIDVEAGQRIQDCPEWFLELLAVEKTKKKSVRKEDIRRFDASMLDYVSSDNRDTWVKVGMALHASYGEDGFGHWQAWSARSDKYEGLDDCLKVWASFGDYDGPKVSVASIIHLARQKGWEPGSSLTESIKVLEQLKTKPKTTARLPYEELLENVSLLLPTISVDGYLDRYGKGAISPSARNVSYALKSLGFTARLNVITRQYDLFSDDDDVENLIVDGKDRRALTAVFMGRCVSSNMKAQNDIHGHLFSLAEQHPYNPFEVWARDVEWDGLDRVPALVDTIMLDPLNPYGEDVLETYLRHWLVAGAVAATNYRNPRQIRGVLTFVGPQRAGKTMWFKSLVPQGWYAEGIQMDFNRAGKDSIMAATSAPLAELGELDATFRKSDQAALKGFLSQSVDKYRPPYGRDVVEFPRITLFCASVNHDKFLRDNTGASRFWPVHVMKCDWQHKINIQQLWAQAFASMDRGDPWHLDDAHAEQHEEFASSFQDVPAVWELIETATIDRHQPGSYGWFNVTNLLTAIGHERPSNAVRADAVAWLKKYGLGYRAELRYKGHRGRLLYRVPLPAGKERFAFRVEKWNGRAPTADDDPKPA